MLEKTIIIKLVNAIKDEWDGLALYTREQIIKESHEATTNLETWESLSVFAKQKGEK